MKKIAYIFSAVLLLGCTDIDRNELIKKDPILNAVFIGGQKPEGIRYFELPLSGETVETPREAEIKVMSEDGESVELQFNGKDYFSDEDFYFETDAQYRIEVFDPLMDSQLSASVFIPPAILPTTTEYDTVYIGQPGDDAFFIEWNSPDEARYSFVVKLENLEELKIPIVQSPTAQFRNRFSGPQLEPFLNLLKSDFTYYGLHRLTVYIMDREFESLFFFDAADFRGIVREGPGNVLGGNGYLAGVSSFELELFIQE